MMLQVGWVTLTTKARRGGYFIFCVDYHFPALSSSQGDIVAGVRGTVDCLKDDDSFWRWRVGRWLINKKRDSKVTTFIISCRLIYLLVISRRANFAKSVTIMQ